MMKGVSRLLMGFLALWLAQTVFAHEVRSGYLELQETAANTFSVLWKIPMKGSARLKLEPRFPEACSERRAVSAQSVAGAMIERWSLACEGELSGGTISIAGLDGTLTDVLVHIERLDKNTQTARLTPGSTSFQVLQSASDWQVGMTYFRLGVAHILQGVDHLLFVLALLIIVNSWRTLFVTITAFTIAHSITLAAATLGYIYVPQQPVEAVIALSILFLATEIIHIRHGRPGLAQRWPWLVAFVFGLLHGFGFAGALTEIGLPAQTIPMALLFFNIGVEVGQLLFVTVVIIIHWLWLRMAVRSIRWAQVPAAYTIGSVAAYWTIERVAGFWA
jgi:hydrogenase/urease accessory protein HupE